ncbi:hypothetical protein C1H76_9011 [Elsinoe australis]|uniref:Uncharacterized protein n=1 Tax=Elsinoe australis TaxID=40998 RepID=A0A4U7AQB8_9PEZI|nr:hypothetical protein C1H76_9011 [Elsinoe australis]
MARRSSARIRAKVSSTPQPSKTTDLIKDGQLRTPKTAPQLASVAESDDEMPGAFPKDDSPDVETPSRLSRQVTADVGGKARTPQNRPPRPSDEEMHPEKYHNSTSKPLDEARWLGISAMVPHTEPPKAIEKWTPAADTPTKNVKHADMTNTPAFEFTFRAQSLELSNEARQMMAEKREEAARIKREMARIEEEKEESEDPEGRKKAKPKGRVGRFSDVHMAQFKKMDSIANHASVSRPNSRDQNQDFRPSSRDRMQDVRPSSRDNGSSSSGQTSKIQYPSLKRSGSKAGLKQGGRDEEEKTVHQKAVQRPTHSVPTPEKNNRRPTPEEGGSPAKRVRLDTARTALPVPAQPVVQVATPSVMQQSVHGSPAKSSAITYPSLSTPTKSSLARAATVKANKTSMIPSLTRTPSKSASKAPPSKNHAGNSLLARSPTKFAHMSAKKEAPRVAPASPLLARSPTKSLFTERLGINTGSGNEPGEDKTPFLSRSPARLPKEISTSEADAEPKNKIPLLARTPAKPSGDSNPFANLPTSAGPKSNLMDRFKLLRKSPIKSILRTPQRLYSDDPNKIAAGTHLATPPTARANPFEDMHAGRGRVNFDNPPATEPISKHVDFSASTKSNEGSPLPSSRNVIEPQSTGVQYPSLPSIHEPSTNKASKLRRQTLGPTSGFPKDFTFRADMPQGITFGPSPSASKHSPKPSIRHVSAEPSLPASSSKLGAIDRKRKFVEEDDVFAPAQDPSSRSRGGPSPRSGRRSGGSGGSDKENDASFANVVAGQMEKSGLMKGKTRAVSADPETRPSKRVRTGPQTLGTVGEDDAMDVEKEKHVPIWAKGTAAQKARASLARNNVGKRGSVFGAGGKVQVGRGIMKPGFGMKGKAGTVGGAGDKSKGTNESAAVNAGGNAEKTQREKEKGVLSRARLDALSQPKRRVGA